MHVGYLIIPGVSRNASKKFNAVLKSKNSFFGGGGERGEGETFKSVQCCVTDTLCHVKKLKRTIY